MELSTRPLTLLHLLLLLVLTEGKRVGGVDTRPVTCVVTRDVQTDLSRRGLTQVPANLPVSTHYLDLSHNNITQLRDLDLLGLPDLCVLKLAHNRLHAIAASAFQGSPKIQVLDISFNALRTIPDLALPELRVLDLSDNLYGSYHLGGSYSQLRNLTSLALGSPRARSVKLTDFVPLSALSLKQLLLGNGVEMDGYEPGSLAGLLAIREVTLKMTFCQKPEIVRDILRDLDKTGVKGLTFVKFLPDVCNVPRNVSEGLKDMKSLLNLTFQDTWFNSSVLTEVVRNILQSPIQVMSFLNITFSQDTPDGVQIHSIPGSKKTGSLVALTFDTIHHYQYNFPLISLNASLFATLTEVKFSVTGMSILPCDTIAALPSLQELDLSDNLLNERGLWWPACSFTHMFPTLRSLRLRNNKFKDLQFIANHTHQMKTLDMLDLSDNVIQLRERSSWPPHLTSLVLSDNLLGDTVFDYLSPYIQNLNLSQTGISALTQNALSRLPAITRLFLTSNNMKELPTDLWAPHLEELHLDHNNINSFLQSSFEGLRGLRRLKAGNNPFACNCELYWFVTSFNKSVLIDWPFDYTCFSPPDLAHIPLEQYRPSRLSCDPGVQTAVSLTVALVTAGVLGLAFHACDGAWYLRMLWVWMRVKRRGHLGAQSLGRAVFKYHAFISYSHQDSAWVDTHLVPNLEGARFSLCIHERDFVPGDWIIDNIVNCVESSYKTLFVLSRNFVRSEWCNYELFFAQHRALSVRQDSLVFILLESIPADSLPRKFLKLRTLLRQQTYLEWPRDQRKQQVFWASLRAMLWTGHRNMVLEHVAKDLADLCPLLKDTDEDTPHPC